SDERPCRKTDRNVRTTAPLGGATAAVIRAETCGFACHGRWRRAYPRRRRRGRVAEGGGLLNRYTAQSRIEGSNPSVSAICFAGIGRVAIFNVRNKDLDRVTIH